MNVYIKITLLAFECLLFFPFNLLDFDLLFTLTSIMGLDPIIIKFYIYLIINILYYTYLILNASISALHRGHPGSTSNTFLR